MEELSVSPWILAAMFFVVALAYSAVGLGGGSSYTALLAIFGAGHRAIPTVSLAMNLVVTSAGSVNYVRGGHLRRRLILPFLATSIPCTFLGASLDLPKTVFYWILMASLVFVALRIYVWDRPVLTLTLGPRGKLFLSLFVGAALGLTAGIVGIGGGIYLVPFIVIIGLGTEKEAAASGSVFIWVNSLVGLITRAQHYALDWWAVLPLAGAALLGGLVGSHLGAGRLSRRTMQRVLGATVLVAIVLLVRKVV